MAEISSVKDKCGECFIINPTTRKVTVPYAHEAIGTVGDHLSEHIAFKCPRMVDGHDVLQCKNRYVAWANVHGEKGCDELKVVQDGQDEEGMIYLTWTVRRPLTVAKGIIRFSLHFEDVDEDGTTQYRWSTATCKDCKILDSVNAVMGKYEAVYVSGDTLVFSDYTPVHDKTLPIEPISIIPNGKLTIKDEGTHDVFKFAEVEVVEIFDRPIISVDENGRVSASANGKTATAPLTAYEPNLIPENIRHNVSIFGVIGRPKITVVDIQNNTHETLSCQYTEYDANGDMTFNGVYIECGETQVIRVPRGSQFCLYYDGNNNSPTTYRTDSDNVVPITLNTEDGTRVFLAKAREGEMDIVIRPYIPDGSLS